MGNHRENSYLNFHLLTEMLISAAFPSLIKMFTLVRSNQTKIPCVTYLLVIHYPFLACLHTHSCTTPVDTCPICQLPLERKIGHFGKCYNTLFLSPQILHKHFFQFLLGLTMVPRENQNNAYAKFGGTNKEYYGIFESGLLKN